ncbi:MAG: UDP-N-acetylmuramate dehydrogenase [Spirochaetaceae bacterium]|jgi:UDP-N-acetylmuramate dehydrogenase|nr:UDP-N-acetylmuramate dehydrogenase [Spirochaetaceae bacterium]
MSKLSEFVEKINSRTGFTGTFRFDEPMAAHTSFRVGGPADLLIRPDGDCFLRYAAELLPAARAEGIPVFILGAGANLLVADRGIRGIVLDTGGWSGWDEPGGTDPKDPGGTDPAGGTDPGGKSAVIRVRSGTAVDALAGATAALGWGGLEFLAGMPGSVGGAVWMNARCYGRSVSDILLETEILDGGGNRLDLPCRQEDFAYKKSPFQDRELLILSARFALEARPPAAIREEMEGHRRDREAKGHYRFPSAGSVFKNHRALGKPMGQIIDELGLRGLSAGGAAVAPFHGNIIINTGNATAADIRALTGEVAARVKAATGFSPEPEIRFVGDW